MVTVYRATRGIDRNEMMIHTQAISLGVDASPR
jgi:hypothetical protein